MHGIADPGMPCENIRGAHPHIGESQPSMGSLGISQQVEQGEAEILESW